jgi:RNA polymerase sigma-70 factor (ECF subfamily)
MHVKENIVGLINGSYKDFKCIYDTYYPNLYGFIFGLVKSHSDTKDIAQETFMKVWINRKSIDPEQSFKSWLFKIAQNLITDSFRKQLNNPVFLTYANCREESPPDDENIEQKMDFDLFRQRLEKAKTKLSPRQKKIFEMNKEEDIPPGEIAKLLDINEQTVYNQLSGALKIIKKEIKREDFLFFL